MTQNGIASTRRGSGHTIGGPDCSWLPTAAVITYGNNVGGAIGRIGKIRWSLQAMAQKDLWPDGHHDLGYLNPAWLEQFMGFPAGWTELDGEPSVTP